MKFRTHEEARKHVISMGLKRQKEFQACCKSGKMPDDIPRNPNVIYKGEFISWGDFLGTGNVATQNQQFRTHEEARKHVISMGFKNRKEFQACCKSGKMPDDIPRNPNVTYKGEFISWGDFLGTGNVATQNQQFRTHEEARKHVISMGFKNRKEFLECCKSGKMPDDIPRNPFVTYKGEFISWGDFLGTGNVSNQIMSSKSREVIIKYVQLFNDNLHLLSDIARYYVFLQGGIDPNNCHIRLLKSFQGGKISLNKLFATTCGEDDIDNDKYFLKETKKPNMAQILKFSESPLIAGLDKEAIEAIEAELKFQMWDLIHNDEESEIAKLRGIVV